MTPLMSHSLEDAIAETKFGKFNVFIITLSGLILACAMLETNCINMIIPIAQCELQMTNFHKGLLGSVGYIGIILSSHFWGFMADTRGRKRVIVPALLLSFIFTICSTLVNNFWLLVTFRFFNGFW
jgi:VNT family MFS transporter (synaptic vesicle glycoprotein 2)